ncbi:TIM barrel protein [Corynebacterium sp. 335C]
MNAAQAPDAARTPYADVANCSTLLPGLAPAEAARAAKAAGWDLVEFWWPFAVPDPSDDELRRFADGLGEAGVRLVAVNLWGGDMAAGDRGVLHRADLPAGHLDAVLRLHELTGVARGNLLPGAGGPDVLDVQRRRLAGVARALDGAFTPMLEPLSGNAELPVRDPWLAADLAGETGCGVLLDFFHLAELGADVDRWLADASAGRVPLPEHVQVADSPGRGAPGTGTALLARWVAELNGAGYGGHVAAEWNG